jgi:hypothetical protein
MANNEETYETNASALELATALVDEDNIEELEPILQDSLDEINGKKEFLCPECNKKYKTERGRNRHILNKQTPFECSLSKDDLRQIVKEVVDQVISDGWYGEHIEAQLKDLPSICCDNDTFVNRIQHCYRNMEINLNQDTLVNVFASNIFPDIPTMFPKNDSRFLNIVFINLPARLASYIKKRRGVVNVTCVQALTDQEKGPLRYIAGAVISKLYRKSHQNKSNALLENALLSMRVPSELNEYMRNIDRGGLWNPCDLLVTLIEIVEIIFREETTKTLTCIPTSIILKRSLDSPEVISHWDAIIHDYSTELSEECLSSCLENIVKLFITIRSYSHTRNIIEKYKILEKVEAKKRRL